ncbi:MAG: hypothetical protein H0X30_22705 [Anaerolineae bacterium]|nr:hypothetical protein [Anaerolineae bacterium]
MNTPKTLTTEQNEYLLTIAGLNAHRWLPIAQRIADNHPECIDLLKQQAYSKFSGIELERALHKLDQAAAMPGLEALYMKLKKPQTLTSSIHEIAESIANPPPVEGCPQINQIAVDPELMRLALGLKQSPQARLWLVVLQMVRNTNVNHVLRADLEAALPAYGVTVSERNLRRWMYRGHGLFWELTETHIHFSGYETVARRLVEMALEHRLTDLIGTNRPGKRSMYIDVSGSLQQFEANVYAAWLASRENPTIARFTLCALWNREARILRKWEKLANVDVVTNEAQYHPTHNNDVPDHAYQYQAALGIKKTETRFRARMVNTYHAPAIRQHPQRGQSRRVFRVIGEYLESVKPAGLCQQGMGSNAPTGGLKPTGRRYFENATKARSSAKHTGSKPRYIALGADDHNRMVWDYTPDGRQQTTLGEELPLITQKHFTPKQVYAKDVIYA